jgi:hypothetical protein
MSIVDEIYKKHKYEISDKDLTAEIINHAELDFIDLWLLPQYPFDEWRKKYDYPRILKNIKERQPAFSEWMNEYEFTDDVLADAYISSCIRPKYRDPKVGNKSHLIKVSYKGKVKHQVWDKYDGKTESEGDGEKVCYEYIREFVSYSDWCEAKGYDARIVEHFDRYDQNTKDEQVYLNGNIRLLKMGGEAPPTNSLGILMRGKKLEFINVSGLRLKDNIVFSTFGNLEFHYCAVDNLFCTELDIPFLMFNNCTVRNIQITNSEIYNWKFVNSYVTGNIKNSSLHNCRIWGGQFIPHFENSEPDNFGVWHFPMKHATDFDRTYRALYKANQDFGDYREAKKFKISELDFKRDKQQKFNWLLWSIDKYYWGYGLQPQRIILFTIIAIFIFGVFYSFFPSLTMPNYKELSAFEKFGNSIYCSVATYITLGYSDISPRGFLKIIASIEALLGAISMGFLVVSLTRTKD